eukprot:4360861-Lingulodinium_polyedra.AAC.1
MALREPAGMHQPRRARGEDLQLPRPLPGPGSLGAEQARGQTGLPGDQKLGREPLNVALPQRT